MWQRSATRAGALAALAPGLALVLAALSMAAPTPAAALTCTWDGDSDNLWATPANWDALCLAGPTGLDVAVINMATTVLLPGSPVSVSELRITHGSAIVRAQNITPSLTVNNDVNGAGTLDAPFGSVTVNGNMDVATFVANAGVTTVGGNWSVINFTNGGGSVDLNGPPTSDVNNPTTFFNLNVTGSYGLNAPITVDNSLDIGGVLDLRGNDVTVVGSITGTGALNGAPAGNTISAGVDLAVNTYSPAATNTVVGGNWTVATFAHGGNAVELTGSGSLAGATFDDLTISGGTRAASAAITVNGDLAVDGGVLDMVSYNLSVTGTVSGAGTLDMNAGGLTAGRVDFAGVLEAPTPAAMNVSGDFLVSGTFNHNNSVVSLNGGGLIDGDLTFNHLQINSGAVHTLLGPITMAGNLNIFLGALDIGPGNPTITVAGDWDRAPAGTDFDERFGLVVLNGTGAIVSPETFNDLHVAAGVRTSADLVVLNDLVIDGTLDMGTNDLSVGF